MELAIYNIKGEDTGRKVQLNDEVFAIEANEHAVYLDVKQYLLTNVKVLTKLKKEAKYQVQPVSSTSKKVVAVLALVISIHLF